MLTGFKSLWAYPKLCIYATAETIWQKNLRESASDNLFFSTATRYNTVKTCEDNKTHSPDYI